MILYFKENIFIFYSRSLFIIYELVIIHNFDPECFDTQLSIFAISGMLTIDKSDE